MDALNLPKTIVAGFDWGGCAASCAVALWPERFEGLITMAGYDIYNATQNLFGRCTPGLEKVMWYQHLFQSERGRRCLENDREGLCRLLWEEWSPNWKVSEELFKETAKSFHNPDFVDVVIGIYRHTFGTLRGVEEYEDLERRLAERPKISLPTVSIDGTDDPLKPSGTGSHSVLFTGKFEHRTVKSGHALPYERPQESGGCILTVRRWCEEGGDT